MLIDNKRITKVLAKYDINLGRLIKFLQDKQIPVEIIVKVLPEVIQELEENKQWYKDPLMYPPNYRKHMDEFPEDFWIDNYILERCRMLLDELISNKTPLSKDEVGTLLLEKKIDRLNAAMRYILHGTDVLLANTTKPSRLRRLWMRLNEPIWSRQTWIWTRHGWRWMEKPKKKEKRK
jgi:hypothetical protein